MIEYLNIAKEAVILAKKKFDLNFIAKVLR